MYNATKLNISFSKIDKLQLPLPSNERFHPSFKIRDWKKADWELIEMLDIFCKQYGYPTISSRIASEEVAPKE